MEYVQLGNSDLCVSRICLGCMASGKLAKRPGETSRRQEEDTFMHFKYDATAEQDKHIVERVIELADRKTYAISKSLIRHTACLVSWLSTSLS